MHRLSTPAVRWWPRAARALLCALICLPAGPALAQSLESALAPGPVTASHAKAEAECSNCHVRFDRAGQDKLCVACHKDIGQDLIHNTGLHGRQKPQTCRGCHTDHRGREMNIAPLNSAAFDHRQTDYLLRGKHVPVACKSCHLAGKKYSQAASDCLACHAKDDKHKGTLGKACADCHVEEGWKETRFDHGKTQFALTGKHIDTKCDACHKTKVYSEAPTTCIGCHKKEDKHKARFGDKCETCHTTRDWKGLSFSHDKDTKYPLRGKHRETKCESCHTTGYVYRDKLGTDCVACHKKDDKHKGTLGAECVACHNERSWKEAVKFNHDKSRFPLRGGHVKAECKACHTTPLFREAPSECVACHNDKHEATLGTACADCHTDRDWKVASRFDHARTRFALRNSHAVPPLKCQACHVDLRSLRHAAASAKECLACHKKDDKHEGQLGARCDNCHDDGKWTNTRFDHARARFALVGGHVRLECKACHATQRYRDAARECVGCHRKDDKHKARFGEKCESCHNVRDWRLWSFDHQRRTDYPLQGAHAKPACEACHTQPAPAGKAAAPLDRNCQSCHRRDDVHDTAFGARCDPCHTPTRWKQVTNRRLSAGPAGPRVANAWKVLKS